jgi:hypothetical protein
VLASWPETSTVVTVPFSSDALRVWLGAGDADTMPFTRWLEGRCADNLSVDVLFEVLEVRSCPRLCTLPS